MALASCAAVAALALDQATKALAIANADILAGGLRVLPGFNLVLHRNTGVSFGLLGEAPPIALAVPALGAVALLAVLALRAASANDGLGHGLVIGGALGNVADRLRLGGVTDLLDFHIGETHWPAFNLADVALVCGVALLLLGPLRSRRSRTRAR